ncbi:hypothetical protein O6H91_06G049700 [Diphasiastrum complanatum]|uniref:Uncharacterized protein n=1 Tax=Diphasiastrum complanatum TaxID=34168 RepID=A0ACC2DDW8_DIPCM|nr:hypothetical protein O6H91_Y231300 [Diphasiastrum complanatum]KAJ7552309.1 hypothetical protein O6H91_06G049700 [Diphasiastrum complanatum]
MSELSKIIPCLSVVAIGPALEKVTKNLCPPQRAPVTPMLSSSAQDGKICRSSAPSLVALVVDNNRSSIVLPKVENSGVASRSRSVTKGSFQADADIGRVECSNRGCRPVYEEDVSFDALEDDWLTQESAGTVLESRIAIYHNRASKKDQEERHKPSFSQDFAEFLSEVWIEKGSAEKYYEAALNEDRHNAKLLVQYAQFAWSTLANVSKAEKLFKEAISESPDDPHILASYAHFLWQSEA